MKLVRFILGISAGILGIGNRAEAQDYPWCLHYGTGFSGMNCGFTTFQQCLDTGIGGFCMQNNTYQLPQARRPIARRARTSLR